MRLRRGFSLIELTVVLLILALVSASVAVAVREPLHRVGLRGALDDLAEFDHLTRTYAREQDRPVVLVFDLDAGVIRRMDETGRTELGLALRLPADYRIVRLRAGEDDWRSGQTVLAVSALGLTPTYAVLVTGPGPRAQWMALAGLSGQLLEPKNDAEVDNLFKARQMRPDAR